RDTIQTAKAVASLDQVSGRRFLFGIGGGWNQDEMEDHGTVYTTRFKKMREQIEAMREIWTKSKPEYHGETVDFPPMMTWPKPVQSPLPVIVGGAFPHAARRAVRYGNGWAPIAGRAPYGDIDDYLPKFKAMLAEAGRKFEDVPITLMGGGEDVDLLKRYRDMGKAGGGPNGVATGPDGALYVCNNGGAVYQTTPSFLSTGPAPDYKGGSIQRIDPKTGETRTLYSECNGHKLSAPNDIVFDKQGGFC